LKRLTGCVCHVEEGKENKRVQDVVNNQVRLLAWTRDTATPHIRDPPDHLSGPLYTPIDMKNADVPYAADAEVSLTFDELQVSLYQSPIF
jgi:hypothetical protein